MSISGVSKRELENMLPAAEAVAALYPFPSESEEEGTHILLRSGEELSFPGNSIQTLAEVYAEREDKDFTRVGRRYAALMGEHHATIYPLSVSMTLVALKSRSHTFSAKQSTMALINVTQVARVVENRDHSQVLVVFWSGKQIPILLTKKTAERKLRRGSFLHFRRMTRLRREIGKAEMCLLQENLDNVVMIPAWKSALREMDGDDRE